MKLIKKQIIFINSLKKQKKFKRNETVNGKLLKFEIKRYALY